ncbi:uncharacterized protein KY384_002677 [Bacidia gigantensis]|uniref:uncharacterized protein n=1 Tax=Bacidia gigantensis TaxID=2732470 RepID=UPI001D04A8B9|nr:uncharacterized protein KY384_002677 [Bacidia gigantensis]KAG8532799.1 hypothetical protein KY384_002677 [Bacidia gigantensis]
MKGVCHLHLNFRLEMQTSILLLTDTSSEGTFVKSADSSRIRRLKRATWPLLQSSQVSLGRKHSLKFNLVVPDFTRTVFFPVLHEKYLRSVGSSPANLNGHALVVARKPSIVDDRYIKLHAVGKGRFETVNTCLRLADGVLLALKTMARHAGSVVLSDPHNALVTARETMILSRIKHPNVVNLVDHFETQAASYICTDFVPAGSLTTLLSDPAPSANRLHIARTFLRQTLRVVSHLHQRNICHGRIAAESVLIQSKQPFNFKMCNFGQARQLEAPEPAGSGTFFGDQGSETSSRERDIHGVAMLAMRLLGVMPNDDNDDLEMARQLALTPQIQSQPYGRLLQAMTQSHIKSTTHARDCLKDSWLLDVSSTKRRLSAVEAVEVRPAKRAKTQAADTISANDSVHGGSIAPRVIRPSHFTREELGLSSQFQRLTIHPAERAMIRTGRTVPRAEEACSHLLLGSCPGGA